MSLSGTIDHGSVPACRMTPRLMLSLYFEDARPLITWTRTPRDPFALRALFYRDVETRVLLQFIGEMGPVASDLVPMVANEMPSGNQPMLLALLGRIDAIFGTQTPLEFVNFEREDLLHPDKARLMTRDGKMVQWGVREVAMSFPDRIKFESVSNHQLMELSNHPELEFFQRVHL